GTGDLRLDLPTFTGDHPADFAVADDHCSGKTVAAGDVCSLGIVFLPQDVGNRRATLHINDNANGSPDLVALSGNGVARPAVSLSPDHLGFGQLLVGATSGSQPVTLTNSGVGSLTITNIVASGDYGETNNCGGSLAGRSSCTVMVTFSPGDSGPRSGTLTISDNAGTGSQAIDLTGTGTMETDFYFAEGFTAAGFRETLSLFMPNNSGTAASDY